MNYKQELAATRIQSRWRSYWQRKQYKLMREAYYRRLKIEEEMRQIELEQQRQKLIYQRQLEAWYQKVRQEAAQKIIDDRRVAEVSACGWGQPDDCDLFDLALTHGFCSYHVDRSSLILGKEGESAVTTKGGRSLPRNSACR